MMEFEVLKPLSARERERLLAEARLKRAEALVDTVAFVGGAVRRLARAIARATANLARRLRPAAFGQARS